VLGRPSPTTKGEGDGDEGVEGVEGPEGGVGEGLFDRTLASFEGDPGGVVLSSLVLDGSDFATSAGGDGVTWIDGTSG
jgi:hypothetical protein